MSDPTRIVVRGAREHNLRDVNVDLPRNALVVFTGVSGSGKSSLAFDTLYKEGQRRFMESLSSYARQFLGQMERPKVDSVDGISPTVCIDQKTVNRNPRSTVGTITEIYDHLRLLMARLGTPHCPVCGSVISKISIEQVVDQVLEEAEGRTAQVLGTVVRDRKGEYRKELDDLRRDGWTRVRVDGALRMLDESIELVRYEKHTIEVVVDRLVLNTTDRTRVVEAVETAVRLSGDGTFALLIGEEERTFSVARSCATHPEISVPELEPRLFSFNAPQGACGGCAGLGVNAAFEISRLVDFSKPPAEGFQAFNEDGRVPFTRFDRAALFEISKRIGGNGKQPLSDWSEKAVQKLLHGDPDLEWRASIERPDGTVEVRERPWEGLLGLVENVWRWTRHAGLEPFRVEKPCAVCEGRRLNPVALAVTFRERPIYHYTRLSVKEAFAFFSELRLAPEEREIGGLLLAEIRERLTFLHEVGLDYLSLDRSAATLSGGEGQRIRLAAQVGSALQGVTYVLDEPSIGLHPRDNRRLLQAVLRLRDRGNTVLVVEHDAETILAADYVVDVGPGAGREGGLITGQGHPSEFVLQSTLTSEYLRGDRRIVLPARRRPADGAHLRVLGARSHNLKSVDVRFPLGVFTVVTGVSGSGKSTLVFDILEPALRAGLLGSSQFEGCSVVEGISQVDSVITISQAPIGRTPRSNPATYTGAMDKIRDLFAATAEAKARGYKKGRFSFNVAGGRCEECGGAGVKTIEMQFLPSVEVTCESCLGRRFGPETLEILWKGKSISEVLDLPIRDALELFRPIPALKRILETLDSVGLGYITLGQPATTLSGGEAQRLKLATELHRPSTGKTLYLLDEPTTGLHFEDVRRLLDAMQRLVDAGNTVIVVEHHSDVVKCADWIVDLGPEGGDEGGRLVGEGTPEEIALLPTPTGRALAELQEFGAPLVVAESPSKLGSRGVQAPPEIRIDGARKHNLQGINVRIPHGKMTVITGPSGSGKTSLAFDTIFSEGQRRYVESLSTYARRFLGRMERAPVDRLEGLAPAIAIDQRSASHNPRSTVATVTEIHDVLRLLYARIGQPHCPECGEKVEALEPSGAAGRLKSEQATVGWMVAHLGASAAPEPRRKELIAEGWSRLLDVATRKELVLDEPDAVGWISAGCALVVDRLDPSREPLSRVSEAVAQAQRLGGDVATFYEKSGRHWRLSARASCPTHGVVHQGALTPRHFSFNSRLGACETCDGIGIVRQILPERVFPKPDLGFWEAMDPRVSSILQRAPRTGALLEAVFGSLGMELRKPVSGWKKNQRDAVLYGVKGELTLKWTQDWGKIKRTIEEKRSWDGLIPLLDSWNSRLAWLSAEGACPRCAGGRLRPELLSVRLGGLGIHEITSLTVTHARTSISGWELTGEREVIAERPLSELKRRLTFLEDVGLGYLSLDRPAEGLSGGESQRIRLASQIGTGLTGVIYVLDEPTVGLHPQDTEQLLNTLEGLRELGNTLVVVEHDPETMLRADHVIDLGPGAGRFGGELLAAGTPAEVAANPRSLTGRWLSGVESLPKPPPRRKVRAEIVVQAPVANNLRCGDVTFGTGIWTCVTGVSGSGKSSLVMDTMALALRKHLGEAVEPAPHGGIRVGEKVDRVVVIDQNPIGRTPRSTPATYTGIMDGLRALFASTPGAQERGWTAGRFSFNSEGGRCESCEGRGSVLIEMHFLPDVWMVCPECNGRRYGRETLAVRWKGLSIADVLSNRIDETLEVFQAHRNLAKPLQALVDVGLGYLSLGQPGNTLSGGEAQRVKLAAELTSRKGHAVYVLDEPTTGLHLSDVKRLVAVLHRLVDAGHTVITIEHHLDMMRQSDVLLELGPGGGDAGGLVIAQGTPTQVGKMETPTGRALSRR